MINKNETNIQETNNEIDNNIEENKSLDEEMFSDGFDEKPKSGFLESIKNFFNPKKKIENVSLSDLDTVSSDLSQNDIKEETKNAEDIFAELGDLDFGQITQDKKIKEPINPLVLTVNIINKIFLVTLVLMIILSIDIYIKTTNSNNIISALPFLCDYIGNSINNYENSKCETLPTIFENTNKSKEVFKNDLVKNLKKLIPRKMQASNIISSSEIRFIQEKVAGRIPIIDIINKFDEIRKKVKSSGNITLDGRDIDCSNFSINNNGEFDVTCNVYGGSLVYETSSKSSSSRVVALNFLNDLQNEDSNFVVLNTPNSLSINKYNDILNAFTTQTTLNLKLKFILYNNKT